MKKALSAVALILISFIYAQELGKEVSISKNWISVVNLEGNELKLSNGSITNHSGKSTKKFSLDFYLSRNPYDPSNPDLPGALIAKNPIKSLRKNSSISGISLQNKVKQIPQDGTYYQILVLSEVNGEIKDIVQLHNQIVVERGKMKPTKEVEETAQIINKNKKSETNMAGVTDITKPAKLTIREDKSITLEKEWKIEIDFKNFITKIIGGDIANNRSEKTSKIILDVYLTKDEQTKFSSNFQGLHIATAPMDPVEGSKRLTGVSAKTNLRVIPPQGTYYLLLTISEIDKSGNPVVISSRTFKNPITF